MRVCLERVGQGKLNGRGNDNSYQVPTVGSSFYINYFMDFLKDRYAYLHLTHHEIEHQRQSNLSKISSSSLVELGFELGQFDPFLYTSLPSLGPDLKDGCDLVVR